MMSKKVKWGVLSTAQIGVEQVIPAINRSSNGRVNAIASSSGKAQSTAERLNIPKYYETYEELLQDPEIDAVYIPLPNKMHYEWTIKAAKGKKHVLCEKPAALNAKDVEEMISVCKANEVLFMEAFMYRFHSQHQKVKELIQSGAIGEVKMVQACFSFYMENREGNIRLNPDLGGGATYDIGCYCINSIRNILDTEPLSVVSTGEFNADQVDTTTGGVLRFPNNVFATFDCSFDATLRNEYDVVGTKGTIRVPFAYRPDLNAGNGVIRVYWEDKVTEFTINGDQYLLEVEHFSDCILNGRTPVYTGEDTLGNLQVIQAVYDSLKNRTEVKI